MRFESHIEGSFQDHLYKAALYITFHAGYPMEEGDANVRHVVQMIWQGELAKD